jgi:hypothetical protein
MPYDCDACLYFFKNLLKEARRVDRENGNYNPDIFVTSCFINGELEDDATCSKCGVELEMWATSHEGLCFLKKNEELGHIKSNILFQCNRCRVGE